MKEKNIGGRPKTLNNPAIVPMHIENEMWQNVQATAKSKGISASELVRQYIKAGLAKDNA